MEEYSHSNARKYFINFNIEEPIFIIIDIWGDKMLSEDILERLIIKKRNPDGYSRPARIINTSKKTARTIFETLALDSSKIPSFIDSGSSLHTISNLDYNFDYNSKEKKLI